MEPCPRYASWSSRGSYATGRDLTSFALANQSREYSVPVEGGAEECRNRFGTHRFGNEEALASVAVLELKTVELVLGLDALCDGLQSESLAELHQCMEEGIAIVGVTHGADQTSDSRHETATFCNQGKRCKSDKGWESNGT